MNGDIYAEWLRRQGHRVVRTASSYWYDAAPGIFQAFPGHLAPSPSASELRSLMWRHGALAVRFSTPIQGPRGVVSYHLVLQQPCSLDQLEPQLRREVEAGLEHFRIEQISFERLALEGWALQQDTLARAGRPACTDRAAWERLCRGAQDLPGFEAWAATRGGELAAAVLALRQEAVFTIPLAISQGRFLAQHATKALLHALSLDLLQRQGIESVFYHAEPQDERSAAGASEFRPGHPFKLVRQCVAFHPLLRPLAVPTVSRWARKRLLRNPSNRFWATAEGLLSFHLEGLKPIEEQAWPERLLEERARLAPQPKVYSEHDGFQVTSATSFDVPALVDLHETCFSKDEHILVQLGRPFIHAVYRWFVTSPETFVLVARRGDRILGFTTLSEQPYNLPMLRACQRELIKGCLRNPLAIFNSELIWRLARSLFRKRARLDQEKVGQIAFTGVDPACQGQGIGKALKDTSLEVCRMRGMVAVSTGVRRLNHRARLLNERAGFVEVPSRSTRRLLYLRLDLGVPPAAGGSLPHPRSTEVQRREDFPSDPREGVGQPVGEPRSGASAPWPAVRLGPPGVEPPPCHIVIVTPYYWPIQSASTHLMKDLAEGLAEEGRQVTILTNGPLRANHAWPDHPLLDGHIHRAWNPFLRRLGVLPKFFEYLWFMAFFFLRGLAIRKIDLIFVMSTPPLSGLPAALLARLKGAKMVYNLQDIFPDSAVVAGMLPEKGWVYRWLRKAEQSTYRVSDLVASISSSFSEYVQRFVPGTLVATIPNWVDTDTIQRREASEDPAIAAYRDGGGFVVQYAGNIGFMQNLEVVLLAAESLKAYPDIRFVFIGDGNAKQSLQQFANQRHLPNCHFLPMQPLERVPSVYNACDLGVIPLKPGAARIAVPSKTWNYLAAGRPVIGCVEEDSPLAEAIRDSKSGAVVPPSDPVRLAKVILEYRNAPDRVRAEGRQGRVYVEAHLSRRTAIRRYLQMFDRLLGRPVDEP